METKLFFEKHDIILYNEEWGLPSFQEGESPVAGCVGVGRESATIVLDLNVYFYTCRIIIYYNCYDSSYAL